MGGGTGEALERGWVGAEAAIEGVAFFAATCVNGFGEDVEAVQRGGSFCFAKDLCDCRESIEATHGISGEIEDGHFGEEVNASAIAIEQAGGSFACDRRLCVGGLAGEENGGGETLQVPLEWATDGLVEVVNVEDELSVDPGVSAEIPEVGIAAELGNDAGMRQEREVVCHDRNSATEEAERGCGHQLEAKREEALQATLHGAAKQIQSVVMAEVMLPLLVVRTRELLAILLS